VLRVPGRELDARGIAQPGEDVVHVSLDRPLGDDQARGDLFVAAALCHERGDLELARTERAGLLRRPEAIARRTVFLQRQPNRLLQA
jgi:hypothetical protein